jgi:hypothetical protein
MDLAELSRIAENISDQESFEYEVRRAGLDSSSENHKKARKVLLSMVRASSEETEDEDDEDKEATENPVPDFTPERQDVVGNKKSQMMGQSKAYDRLDLLRTYMDDTTILEELMQAMSDQEAVENLDHIIQMHDLGSIEEEEEDDGPSLNDLIGRKKAQSDPGISIPEEIDEYSLDEYDGHAEETYTGEEAIEKAKNVWGEAGLGNFIQWAEGKRTDEVYSLKAYVLIPYSELDDEDLQAIEDGSFLEDFEGESSGGAGRAFRSYSAYALEKQESGIRFTVSFYSGLDI